jgi:hypothetical protein
MVRSVVNHRRARPEQRVAGIEARMTEIPITEDAAREAIRLGYEMTTRLAAAELRARRRRAAMRRAIMLLQSGRTTSALAILVEELRRDDGP